MPSNVVSGFDTTQLGRNDDNFSSAISMPFALNFYGVSYSSVYVSNNGYVTFGAGQSTYSSSGIGSSYAGRPIVAALFADIDTRNAGSGITSWGTGTFAGHAAFGATWPGVYQYGGGSSTAQDTFQILLVDRSDVGAGDADVYLNYDAIQWAGRADAGLNAGVRGDPIGSFYQLPGSLVSNAFIDGGSNALTGSSNTGTPGQYMYEIRGGTLNGVNLFSIAATDAVKPDGLTGTTNYRFTVSRIGDVSGAATLGYSIAGTGATPADTSLFSGLTGSIQFAAGDQSETLDIAISAAAITTSQRFAVTINGPSAGYVITSTASGTIQANSTIVATPQPTVQPAPAPASGDFIRFSPTAIRVMRFFDTQSGSHFFTASATESAGTTSDRTDLSSEATGFLALDPGNAASDPAAAPVYRFFERDTGEHFFTADASERDSIAATRSDMTLEGVAFYEHTTPQTGDTAVYRFFDTGNGSHFFTADANERASLLATRSDLRDEGVAFYAPAGA